MTTPTPYDRIARATGSVLHANTGTIAFPDHAAKRDVYYNLSTLDGLRDFWRDRLEPQGWRLLGLWWAQRHDYHHAFEDRAKLRVHIADTGDWHADLLELTARAAEAQKGQG